MTVTRAVLTVVLGLLVAPLAAEGQQTGKITGREVIARLCLH
jgi:hypothetical protein